MERKGAVVVLIMLAFLVALAGNLTMTMTHILCSQQLQLDLYNAIVCLFCLFSANECMLCILSM
jgi:hypothetical protein